VNPKIVQLIGRSIDSGQILTESRVGLGERIVQATTGAAASVGNAASLVVTAPVAVVDPVTREHFGDEIDVLTQSVHDVGAPH